MLPKGRDGMIDLVLGPMFAGKSTELLRRIKRYRVASKKCMVVRYANDNRYSDK
jgi:thymidine kinase